MTDNGSYGSPEGVQSFAMTDKHTPIFLREHCKDETKGLDRVKLSIQKGPLGSLDRADGERLAASWNALSGISTQAIEAGAVAGLVSAAGQVKTLLQPYAKTMPDNATSEAFHRISTALAAMGVKP